MRELSLHHWGVGGRICIRISRMQRTNKRSRPENRHLQQVTIFPMQIFELHCIRGQGGHQYLDCVTVSML